MSLLLLCVAFGIGTVASGQEAGPTPRTHGAESDRLSAPTFSGDVAPIMHRRCAACHHPQGSGPFSLITYPDVRKRARQVLLLTRMRLMPPWGPTPGHGDFLDSRRMSDAEIGVLDDWFNAGMPLGDPEELPASPEFAGDWRLGTPDVVLSMDEPYTVPAEGFDVWRTFVIPTGFTEDRFVRAVEYRVGNEKVLHHFIMYMDTEGAGRAADAATPGVGYAGMTAELTLRGEEAYGWIPGMQPRSYPEGVATTVRKGTDFILDSHFTPTGRPERVQIEVGLYFADEPPTRFPTGAILLGPGATIPPGASGYTIKQSLTLPIDVKVLSIAPHAHYVCQRVEVFATLPNKTRENLLLIEDWDPDWQEVYAYRDPIDLPRGSRIEMLFTYDNSKDNDQNPFSPPHRVITGKASYNEMAVAWLNVTVSSLADLELLKQHLNTDYFESIEEATSLIQIWKSLVREYDADEDGTLNLVEDARATAYVNSLLGNEPHLLAGFDKNRDGELGAEERAFAEQVVRYWNGVPAN